MRPTNQDNLTTPGSDSFNQPLQDKDAQTACVDCGEFDSDFRKHFLKHYGLNGGEYGRYSAAYEFGYQFGHEDRKAEWPAAEERLKPGWERRGQGGWEDFKNAIRYGWSLGTGKK